MKLPALIYCIALLLCGCADPQAEARVNALEMRLQSEWIKQNVVFGVTTREQIREWYGAPLTKTSSFQSGYAGAVMPDEIWSYGFKISHKVGHIGTYDFVTTRYGLAVSFKEGKVCNISVSSI